MTALPAVPGAWSPDDPFDAMAESFRRQLVDLVLEAPRAALYRDMDPMRQIECFMAGITVGLIGVCFASIDKAGRDEMMKVITEYLPQARQQAEAILDDDGRSILHQEGGG